LYWEKQTSTRVPMMSLSLWGEIQGPWRGNTAHA
jgi:hypothetical protein